jgi:Tat protein translocase TatC
MTVKKRDERVAVNADNKDSSETMSFMDHLEELRQRLVKCLLAVVAGLLVCWFFREELRQFLEAPLYAAWQSVPGLPAPAPLSFTSLMEPFVAYMKIAGIGGLFFASPVIFYQLWRFVSPGLYNREKRMALPFVFISSTLFILGSAGAYAYVFPLGFSFFLQFSSGGAVEEYDASPVAVTLPEATEKGEQESVADERVEDGEMKSPQTKSPLPPLKKGESEKSSLKKGSKEISMKPPAATSKTGFSNEAWRQMRRAYAWVEKKMLGESCGKFGAEKTPDISGAKLWFEYSKKRCGPRPVVLQLERNDQTLALDFARVKETADTVRYEAVDDSRGRETALNYRLQVVREPAQKLLPVLMVKDYLDFAVKLLLAFGLVFELPILIFFLAYAGIVDYMQLIRFGRWFVVLSLAMAAILTPPDVVTQILLATPLVILYYLSIGVVFFLGRKQKRSK